MNVTVKQLRIFIEVARKRSFAAAAKQLHLSQPAISLAIQNLEQHIGGKLFDRNTRHLELTPEGQLFYPTATNLLTQWSDALEDVNNLFTLKRGKLNMAVMPSFASNDLPDIAALYHKQYPHINLAINSIVMDDAIENVRKGHCELAIMFAGQNMQGVEFTPLFSDQFMLIYAQSYASQLDGISESNSLNALLGLPMIAMDKDSSVRGWVDEVIQTYGVLPKIVAEVNQLETLGRLVAKGMGVGIVPSLCREQMQSFGLIMQPLPAELLTREVGIVTPMNQGLSSAGQAMISVLTDFYAHKKSK
jgi:LysR family carnitine catabolism transcriptional activator